MSVSLPHPSHRRLQVSEIDLDYTDCETLDPQNVTTGFTFTDMPSSKYTYKLRAADSKAPFDTPKYAFVDRTGTDGLSPDAQRQCVLQFDVPANIEPPVLLYYKLTNFFQNHRRYVKSLDQNQLRGDAVSVAKLGNGDCKPLAVIDEKAVYPCGLIANSLFNGEWCCWCRWPSGHAPWTVGRWCSWCSLTRRYLFKAHPHYGLGHKLHLV